MSQPAVIFAEDKMGRKIDKCITDSTVKLGRFLFVKIATTALIFITSQKIDP